MSGVIASQAFAVNKLPGLKLHLDPSDRGSIIHSSGNVFQKNDKSKNGNHATQFTGSNQPLTEADTINGKNVITYDGDDDFLSGPPDIASVALANHTTFFVCRTPAAVGTQTFIAWNDSTGIDNNEVNREVIVLHNDKRLRILSSLFISASTFVPGDFAEQELIIATTVNNDTRRYKVYVNGMIRRDTFMPIPIPSVDTFTVGGDLNLGGIYGAHYKGPIGEIAIFDSALDAEDIETFNTVLSYLSNKWSMALDTFPFLFSSDFSSDFA